MHENYIKRIFKTIEKARLVENGDKIFVALSGGKDSTVALYALKKYIEENSVDCELKGFHINFGFPSSKKVENVIKKQTELLDVDLDIVKLKDIGISFDELSKKTKRPVCSLCGTIKRYLINKIPLEEGANKVATGHNMDDFIVSFLKNFLSQNFSWTSKFRSKLESTHPKLLCKIRPLFEVGNKETEIICKSKKLPFIKEDLCPHVELKCKIDFKRERWYETIYEIEKWNKGFRLQFIKAVEKISRKFEDFTDESKLRMCSVCGQPTNQEICAFCKLVRL